MSLSMNVAITPEDRLNSVVRPTQLMALPVLTYRDQQVITTKALAEGYGTTAIRIQQNHIRNESRFIEGIFYFRLIGIELKTFLLSLSGSVNKHTVSLALWTEWGTSHHAKMLELIRRRIF